MAESTTHDAREVDRLAPAPTSAQPLRHVPALLATERRVLEMVARGRPLAEALDELTAAIETQAPGMLASLLRLDPDGIHLRHGSARSLPPAYCAAIDGVAIGPSVGSCGTAAHEGQVVVATDIATDPRWASWRDVALQYGLRACWSAPIFGADGRVLGTFALYYLQPRAPDPELLALIEGAAQVAGVAIERHDLDEQRLSMIEDLSRAVRFSEMFAGVLGHDLRNPLGAIMTAAKMVKRNPQAATVERNADRILVCSARMNSMIEQLLDFTRIRLGRGLTIQPQPQDLLELCRYAADEVGDAGTGELREILIEHAGNTRGYWDRDRLLQLVSNLVGNAVQHGAGKHPVAIRLDGTQQEQIKIDVVNAGELALPLLKTLFDPFRRAPSDGNSRQGLGLGLFIARQIAGAHGGTIDVSAGRGTTTFTVSLPRGRAEAAPPAVLSFQSAPHDEGRPTVVVIDDDRDLREMLVELFAAEGYAVVSDGSGATALETIRRVDGPCVVVLDMSLPGQDGDHVFRAMRANPRLAKVPVIVTTGDPVKAPSGVMMFRKPIDLKLLVDATRTLFAG